MLQCADVVAAGAKQVRAYSVLNQSLCKLLPPRQDVFEMHIVSCIGKTCILIESCGSMDWFSVAAFKSFV